MPKSIATVSALPSISSLDLASVVGGENQPPATTQSQTTTVQPNFFFHLTHAYAILRHTGVPLGKRDYLGAITLRTA